MPTLKGMYMEAVKGEDLVVSPHHYRWLELPEDEQVYTAEAIQFIVDALQGKFQRPRTQRWSPSSIGGCERRLLFGFVGAPKVADDLDSPDLMGLGKWGHMRWQAEGLTVGWIEAAEVWTEAPEHRVGGSIDAMLFDDSVFELKTIHPFKYTKVVQTANEPLHEHLLQFGTYTVLEGVDRGSIVYEDRSSGNFHEFRVVVTDEIVREVLEILDRVNQHEAAGTLPPMLESCQKRTGQVYRYCPHRKHCPLVKSLYERLEE